MITMNTMSIDKSIGTEKHIFFVGLLTLYFHALQTFGKSYMLRAVCREKCENIRKVEEENSCHDY